MLEYWNGIRYPRADGLCKNLCDNYDVNPPIINIEPYFLADPLDLFYFAGGQAEAGEDYEYWNATHQRRPSNQAPHPGPPPQGPMVTLGPHHSSSMSTEMMVERPNTLELHGTGGGLGARGTPLRSSLKKNSSYSAVYQNVGPGIINLPS